MYGAKVVPYYGDINTEDGMPTMNTKGLAARLNRAMGVNPDADLLGHDRVTPKMACAIMKGINGSEVLTIGCGASSSDINMADRLNLVRVIFRYGGKSTFTVLPSTVDIING